jgi:hypothetical protein
MYYSIYRRTAFAMPCTMYGHESIAATNVGRIDPVMIGAVPRKARCRHEFNPIHH